MNVNAGLDLIFKKDVFFLCLIIMRNNVPSCHVCTRIRLYSQARMRIVKILATCPSRILHEDTWNKMRTHTGLSRLIRNGQRVKFFQIKRTSN